MAEGSTNVVRRGAVKQVLSGDAVVLFGPPTAHGPPQETTVYLANITAPRLAKRPNDSGSGGTLDEPFAWEAREFVRSKLIGQSVNFVRDFLATSGREHGRIYLGGTSIENAENIAESGVSEGWLEVRPGKQNDEYTQKLLELQEAAKAANKGKWGVAESDQSKHVRNIKWQTGDAKGLVEKYHQKPVKAIIEQVRDGSTVRAFLLPDFEYVTINLSGIKTPSPRTPSSGAEPFGEEAKFFVEQRILQREVDVVLESVSNNQNFLGSVIHPKGNIAEFLLKDGYAKTSWSVTLATAGVQALKGAEKQAQEKRLRVWANFTASTAASRKSFEATVVEIGLGDSLTVEKENGEEQKIYLSSIRAPKREGDVPAGGRKFLPLYDIPYMFEAREYLRKTLVGKKVKVTIDYIQPRSEQFPEKTCATVHLNEENVAVNLLEQGLARIVRHRQDDDNRSADYDALMIAESNAEKDKKGLFSDKKPTVRVQEIQGDAGRANQFINYLKKGGRNEGIVEFLSSASRLRVYVPKETVVFTFLLGGISAPRSARIGPGGKPIGENEPFAEEALKFTKKYTFQKEVKVEVDTTDKNGAYIGYMFVKKENNSWVNLSELLLENGFASLHFSAEKSSYYPALATAEKFAKEAKRGIWQNYVEEDRVAAAEVDPTTDTTDRKVSYKKVLVSEIVPDSFRFYAQYYEDGDNIVKLMKDLQEIDASSEGTTKPKRNELVAVKFSNQYHRAKIETIKGDVADIFYVDYGNREQVDPKRIAPLPARFHTTKPLAHEYVLALTKLPNADYVRDAHNAFAEQAFAQQSLLLNVEYKAENVDAVTLVVDDEKKKDIGKSLIQEGYALVEPRREKRLATLLEQYNEAESQARKAHTNIWQYGDARADD